MQATRLDLGTLLHARQPFAVPKYQRSYAWEHDEIEDFTADIRKRWNERVGGQARPHFFGGIVSIHKTVANTAPGRMYEVVDGQQRLATFAILFSVLESAYYRLAQEAKAVGDAELEELASSRALRLRHDYLEYEDEEDRKTIKRLRVVLSKADNQFFENLINRLGPSPTRASHERLLAAWNKIHIFIRAILDSPKDIKEMLDSVYQIQQVATDDCYVVHLVTENRTEAYQLFQVLNDRGMGLSEGDLLRSSTLEILEPTAQQQREAEDLWDEILSGEPQETEGFLRAYYASQRGARAGQRSLFDDSLRAFFPQQISTDAVLKTVKEMRLEIDNYRKLVDGEWPYPDSTVLAWDRDRLPLLINVLKHTLCIPLLLSACYLAEKSFSEIVQMLERCVFRYIIVTRRHPTKVGGIYLETAGIIRKNPNSYNPTQLREKLRALLKEGADDALFEATLPEQMRYKQGGSNNSLKYFLNTLEQYSSWYEKKGSGEPECLDKSTIFDVSNLQIEHVYPQNAQTKIKELEDLKDNLGNLSFWGPNDNKAASNSDFGTKKPIYAQSNVGLNRYLSQFDVWNKDSIQTRTTELIKRAVKIFAI